MLCTKIYLKRASRVIQTQFRARCRAYVLGYVYSILDEVGGVYLGYRDNGQSEKKRKDMKKKEREKKYDACMYVCLCARARPRLREEVTES